jgi:DNA-binding response OmpR family regulator
VTFLETIRKQRQFEDLPVILLTSVQSRHVLLHAAELGVNACVLKNRFELDSLMARIQKIVGEHRKVMMACAAAAEYPVKHEAKSVEHPGVDGSFVGVQRPQR